MQPTLRRTLRTLALAPILMVIATSAQAVPMTVNVPLVNILNKTNEALSYISSANGTIDKFDATLGNLTKATIELSGTVNGDVSCSTTNTVTCGGVVDVEMDGLSLGPLSNPTLAYGNSCSNFLGCTIDVHADKPVSIIAMLTSVADLTALTGIGSIDIPVKMTLIPAVTTGGSLVNGKGHSASVVTLGGSDGLDMTVTYEFTTVPEPSTVLLLSLGLLASAGIRGRVARQRGQV